jgi:hypothetical protein
MTNGQAEAFPKSSGRPQLELSRTERWNIPELIGGLLGKPTQLSRGRWRMATTAGRAKGGESPRLPLGEKLMDFGADRAIQVI